MRFIAFLFIWMSWNVEARTLSYFDDHFLLGACELSKDPAASGEMWPLICVNGEVANEMSLSHNLPQTNRSLQRGRFYMGLHLNPYFSVHGEGLKRKLSTLNAPNDEFFRDEDISEFFFLQLGNRTLTKLSFSIGRMDLPFGVDHRPNMPIFDITLRNVKYWNYPEFAANLTFDNQVDARLEIAVAANDTVLFQSVKNLNERSQNTAPERKRPHREAASLRASYYLSAPEGTRIALSLYEEVDAGRRFGFAILNHGADMSETSFEWIRTGDTLRPGPAMSQLFRLTHASGFLADNRTIFEFEYDQRNYRLLTLGFDKRFIYEIMLRTAASYYWRDQGDLGNSFIMTFGVQAGL